MLLIIEIASGHGAGKTVEVQAGELCIVGRSRQADMVVSTDGKISRAHFEVWCTGQDCVVRDCESTHGTFLNDQPITEETLRDGDIVLAGKTTFRVSVLGGPDRSTQDVDNAVRRSRIQTITSAPESFEEPTLRLKVPEPMERSSKRIEPMEPEKVPLYSTIREGPGRLFVLLDAARSERILEILTQSGERFQSLYEGEKGRELALVAPYLLELPDESSLFSQLVEEGWGQSWGIFIRADCAFDELRKHFRHFLLVKLEDGPDVYFRFYDPRVLRTYLPTCTIGETKQFFGPVFSYLMEAEDAGTLLRFEPGGSTDYPEEIPVQYEDR